jgi:hypothetical protein
MALVAQDAPDLASNCGIVAPVAPAPTNSFAPSRALERLQGLPTDQLAAPHTGEQQEQIGCQMCQLAVAFLI